MESLKIDKADFGKRKSMENTISKEPFLKYVLKHKGLYLLMLPGVLHLLIFSYIPMAGVTIAFKDFDFIKGFLGSEWIGFDNFQRLFGSSEFYAVLRNSLLISIYKLLWAFPFPIILTLLLNEIRSVTYKRVTQTIMYLPHFISWMVVAGMLINMLSLNGAANHIVRLFGGEAVPFLQKTEYFRSIIVISHIWKEAGWGTIVYLAAVSSIDTGLYEAAYIDGANRLQRMWKITLPCIMPTIFVLLILNMGNLLRNGFEQIFSLYNPLVYEVADVFETYTYRLGIGMGQFGYSTAVGIFQAIVGLVLITVTNKAAKNLGQSTLY